MKLLKLGEICELRYGRNLPKRTRSPGNTNVFGSNGIVGTHNLSFTEGETIIIGRKGSIGKINHSKASCWPIDTTYYIDKTCCNQDIRWLYHALSGANLEQLNKATGVPSLSRDDVYERSIFVPNSLDEQKRIAAILDQADAVRRLRQRAIDRLNTLGQSIFYEMFGPICGQRSWKHQTCQLNDVANKITDGTHQAPTWSDVGVPFIFVSNIRDQQISLETKKYVSLDEYKKLTKSTPIEVGDVLYTSVGSYGNTACVKTNDPFIFQRHIAHIKLDTKKALPTFISWCLETPTLRRQADRFATGIAQKTVTLKVLKNFEIPIPHISDQLKFEEKIKSVEALKNDLFKNFDHFENLFSSLQQRAFRGDL